MKKLFILLSLVTLISSYGNSAPFTLTSAKNRGVLKNVSSSPEPNIELMRMNMYCIYPDKNVLVDGTLTQYGPNYSDNIDGYDARKMPNPGEDISLIRNSIDLIIERRQTIGVTDTIFFRMWNMQKKSYKMELVASNLNHPGLLGFLEDSYLNTSTPLNLNDTTSVNFAINNDAGSYSQLRFRIIFKTVLHPTPLPFNFIYFGAYNQNSRVNIDWKTKNEINIEEFAVERSSDGKIFTDLATVNSLNVSSAHYQWADNNPMTDNNYYRIRSLDLNGKMSYSEVVQVFTANATSGISVFPNPVTGNNFNLKLDGQQAGIYGIRLSNAHGQMLINQSINYNGGNGIIPLTKSKTIPSGIYYLEIIKPSGKRQFITVVF